MKYKYAVMRPRRLIINKEMCLELLVCWLGYNIVTTNVSVVYMARNIMILIRENALPVPLEGVGPKNHDFFGS